DGYHELESLVAFAGVGDTLSLEPGEALTLTVSGPNAAEVGADADNLALRAARELSFRVDGLRVGAFHLAKRLPVASGIGGGSSGDSDAGPSRRVADAVKKGAQRSPRRSLQPRAGDRRCSGGAQCRKREPARTHVGIRRDLLRALRELPACGARRARDPPPSS